MYKEKYKTIQNQNIVPEYNWVFIILRRKIRCWSASQLYFFPQKWKKNRLGIEAAFFIRCREQICCSSSLIWCWKKFSRVFTIIALSTDYINVAKSFFEYQKYGVTLFNCNIWFKYFFIREWKETYYLNYIVNKSIKILTLFGLWWIIYWCIYPKLWETKMAK